MPAGCLHITALPTLLYQVNLLILCWVQLHKEACVHFKLLYVELPDVAIFPFLFLSLGSIMQSDLALRYRVMRSVTCTSAMTQAQQPSQAATVSC